MLLLLHSASTFVAEDEVIRVDAVRLESDVHDMARGRIDMLTPGTSTTHGAAAFRVVVHVDAVHWLGDGRVPMTRPINLASQHIL